MSTQTATPAPARRTTRTPYRLNFVRILRSEWIKLATLRSTWWSLVIAAAITLGIALLMAVALSGESELGIAGIDAALMPIQFTMLLAGILGVIAVTGEYSTGMIRSTFTAVPSRGKVLAAKAIVIGVVLFVASLLIFLASATLVAPFFADTAPIDWADAQATYLPIAVASLSMAAFALMGVGFGFVLRAGAGAIAAVVGVLFVLPVVAQLFTIAGESWQWVLDASAYLPSNAAQVAITGAEGAAISVPVAYITLGAWSVGSLIAAWVALRTRDA